MALLNGPYQAELIGGEDFVLAHGDYRRSDLVIATTVCDERGRATGAVLGDGTTLEYRRTHHDEYDSFFAEDGTKWVPYFTLPLPKGGEADRIAYAKAMRADYRGSGRFPESVSEWDNIVAFLITEATDEVVKGRIVSGFPAWAHTDDDGHDELGFRSLEHDTIIRDTNFSDGFWTTDETATLGRDMLPSDVKQGDVVVGTALHVKVEDGLEITTLVNATTLPFRAEGGDLSLVFPKRQLPQDDRVFFQPRASVFLQPAALWLFEREVARRSLQPDVALVLSVPDLGSLELDSERIGILGHKGAVFFADSDGSALESMSFRGMQPGLHLVTSPRFWAHTSHEGEHDSGFDYEDRPATMADVEAFGLDLETLGDNIRGHLDPEEDLELFGLEDDELARMFVERDFPAPIEPSPSIKVTN